MRRLVLIACLAATPLAAIGHRAPAAAADQRGGGGQFSGGLNPDGSLRPSAPVSRPFTQDAYTEYSILEPGSESFRIRYIFESPRAGATEMINATRGGSEGGDIDVYDPRTGKPLKFVYEPSPRDPETHQIRATLAQAIPEGGIGRVLIYKTYKDPRTYMMNGGNIVWVRSLAGYRLGVILPKGFAFVSADVAAQMSTTADGRLKLAFANPSGQSNPVTIHARPTTATFAPSSFDDMFFDDIKTLYDLDAPESGRVAVEQIYSDYRPGERARLDSLSYLDLKDLKVIDLDTARELPTVKDKGATFAKLDVPIADAKQSAHLKVTGTLKAAGYTLVGSELIFQRTLKGLRNTVVLPKGWELSAVSQSGTVGTDASGRAFVALINLNAENAYKITIRAKRGA
jgi:hypothetical protein